MAKSVTRAYPRHRSVREAADRAYVDNYPDLAVWLREKEARCAYQVLRGDAEGTHDYIEAWHLGASIVLCVVRSHRRGWDIYTSCGDLSVAATFADAEARTAPRRRRSFREAAGG